MQDKLLFMGCSIGTPDALDYAKSIHVYTIITDNLPPEQQPLKLQADEYWMIDVKDLDALEAKCKESGVTGVFAATSEFCLDMTRLLCKRLALPFYASDEGWASSRDKNRFKMHCIKYGLSVPKKYEINTTIPEDIHWPVIVKPADSSGSTGISVCHNFAELITGYKVAQAHSASGKVIVEDFIDGDEITAVYILENGNIQLISLVDLIHENVYHQCNTIYINYQSRFTETYMQSISNRVDQMLQNMNCQNGSLFLQMIHKDGVFYFLEMGYRLNGVSSWNLEEPFTGINILKYHVDFALNRVTGQWTERKNHVEQSYKFASLYHLWSRPGKVWQIKGLEYIHMLDGVKLILQNFKAGDTVPEDTSMRQIMFEFVIFAENEESMKNKVNQINQLVHAFDENNHNMLYYLQDFNKIQNIYK